MPETRLGQAAGFLQALGGAGNIESINNCATRLRIALVDMTKTQSDDVFKALGAHGVVRRGNGIQSSSACTFPRCATSWKT